LAIVVQGDRFVVIGSGAVYLDDASGVTQSDVAETGAKMTVSVHDLKIHVLRSGDSFNLTTRRPLRKGAS
jgi:cyanophycinase